ncbi:MAG: serine hydrolase domain-containing protein, partial [Planctomycetota bacterium]
YDQYIQNEFFTPLEMRRSSYGWEQPIIKGRAEGYSRRDDQVVNDDFLYMGHPYAAGSLLSTVDDLIIWTHALHDGRVVDSDSYEQMITPVETSRGNAGYGYGLMIGKFGEHQRIAHGGGIFGFSTQLSYYPEHKLCVAVLLNTDAARASQLENVIARRLLGMPEPAAASSRR